MSPIRRLLLILCIALMSSSCAPNYIIKSECKTMAFNYTIVAPGCESKIIQNNFCYGQCQSFYIPNKKLSGRRSISCSVCRPDAVKKTVVYLKCHSAFGEKFRPQKVIYIKNCSCKRTRCIPW